MSKNRKAERGELYTEVRPFLATFPLSHFILGKKNYGSGIMQATLFPSIALLQRRNPMAKHMTYEAYLDEVTTLLTENYDFSDDAAIKLVMRAQAANFFTLHDDTPSMCTLERAQQDVKKIFELRKKFP